MNSLLTTDLHLTSNPRDEYRWVFFEWLLEVLLERGIKQLYILGDLTDAKDYHSSRLVNRIVDLLLRLYRRGELFKITILRGNHDGIDPGCPYFRFLGAFPFIHYVSTPWFEETMGVKLLLLPHTRDPASDWVPIADDLASANVIMMHGTVKGAVAENGIQLDGIPAGLLRPAYRAKVWSGDVHVPQKTGIVEYVGAPYHIRFGDKFSPRVVMLKDLAAPEDIPVLGMRRHVLTVTVAAELILPPTGINAGDQIKIKVRLAPHELVDWQKVKQRCTAVCAHNGLELCGIELDKAPQKTSLVRRAAAAPVTPQNEQHLFEVYCHDQKVPDHLKEVGMVLLNGDGH